VTAHALYAPPDASLQPGTFRIIGTTESIPQDVILARAELPEPERVAIQQALLRIRPGSPEAVKLARPDCRVEGFVPVTNEDYARVLEVVREEREATAKAPDVPK
jgi:ABC-type phosphate/phosphonate transport system substrate-binding protein